MKNWNEMNDQEQVYLWWEYNANCNDEDQISFSEFDEMMRDSLGE